MWWSVASLVEPGFDSGPQRYSIGKTGQQAASTTMNSQILQMVMLKLESGLGLGVRNWLSVVCGAEFPKHA